MQPATLPPWLSPWAGGGGGGVLYEPSHKLKVLEYYRALARDRARHRSRLTVYTYGHDDSQLLRIGGWSGRANQPLERYPLDQLPALLDHYPLEPASGPVAPDLTHLPERVHVAWVPPPGPTGAGTPLAGRAARGWLAGATVLVLLAVLVRAIEKCLDINIIKSRRRSQEWPTPNVRAVNPGQMIDNGTVIIPGLENAEPLPADLSDSVNVDLPPPYSECTNAVVSCADHNKPHGDIIHEEPPPPYSDTYVEFSNKNGIPSVLIFSRRRTPLVGRHEIVGSQEIDETTNIDPNAENTNDKATNEDTINNCNETVTNTDAGSNDDTVKVNISGSCNTDGNPGTSSRETIVDIDEDEKTQDRVVMM